MTNREILRRLNENPYRPFRIKMVNGTTYDIVSPWQLMPGETSTIICLNPRFDGERYQTVHDWRTVSNAHMIEFSDIDPPKNLGKKKRAS